MSRPPSFERLGDALRWFAVHAAGSEALVDERGRLSHAQFGAEVQRWEQACVAAGVERGDRVAILAPPGREALVSFSASASIGAIWCGLDPRSRTDELLVRITDLQPRLIFAFEDIAGRSYAEELSAMIAALPDGCRLVRLDSDEAAAFFEPARLVAAAAEVGQRRAAVEPRDPCVVVYTSGSTGVPKGALLHHAGVADFCRRQNALWPVSPLRTLNFLPVSHAGSLVDLSLPTLLAGDCVVLMQRFDVEASLRLLAQERISFWASVPSTFILQLASPSFAATDLSQVQLIAVEGAAVPVTLATALAAVAPLVTNYGMTESTSAITALAPTRSPTALAGSVGLPFGDAEVRIAGAARPGEVGEIEVRSPRNMLGYWRRPDATREAFSDDAFLRTGDLGSLQPDGRLQLAGRKKEMFKSGGYNVYPAEVEAVVGAHPGVRSVAVVATPHPLWGEVGVAFIEPSTHPVEADLTESLMAHCRSKLADYKQPKRWVVVQALPLLPIGKVDRAALQTLAAQTLG